MFFAELIQISIFLQVPICQNEKALKRILRMMAVIRRIPCFINAARYPGRAMWGDLRRDPACCEAAGWFPAGFPVAAGRE